jgi:enoyl-CoA hydratase/carnithine racemase
VALHHLETIDQLVVALVDGFCLGGGLQLALACDLRIATDRATLAIPASREVGTGGRPSLDTGWFPLGRRDPIS